MKMKGFTLIELVSVVIILGLLTIVALPLYLNLQSDARQNTVTSMLGSMKYANDQVHAKAVLGYVKLRNPNSGNTDHTFLDLNKDGIQQEEDGEWDLIYNYIDNTHIDDAIIIDGAFSSEEVGRTVLYVGYDLNRDNSVQDDLCWVRYTQAVDTNDEQPSYLIDVSGC